MLLLSCLSAQEGSAQFGVPVFSFRTLKSEPSLDEAPQVFPYSLVLDIPGCRDNSRGNLYSHISWYSDGGIVSIWDITIHQWF